ncbi:MAG: prolipoprotein diacylglyceryl transferase, partial [Anaerolineae bacterium]|nr:prolipoprotein diacylglyceryl transferase [Anaerolineae bacterium]
LGRFFIEYFRPDAWMIGSIAAAQLFAILCVVGGVALLVVRHAKARQTQSSLESSVNPTTEQAVEAPVESPAEPTEGE